MIDCRAAESLISRHLDAGLGASLERELEAHLGICEGCRAALGQEAALSRRLRSALRAEPELCAALKGRVLVSLARDPSPDPSPRPFARGWWPLPLLAAAGLVAGAAIWIGLQTLLPTVDRPAIDEAIVAPSSPGPGARETTAGGWPASLVLQECREEIAPLLLDGDPSLRLKLRRDRMLIDPSVDPRQPQRGRPAILGVELEREEERLLRPVSNPWH